MRDLEVFRLYLEQRRRDAKDTMMSLAMRNDGAVFDKAREANLLTGLIQDLLELQGSPDQFVKRLRREREHE
jgi:hypothetical protein